MLTDIRADKDQANDGLSSSLLILYLDSARNLPVGNAMGAPLGARFLAVDLVLSHTVSPVLLPGEQQRGGVSVYLLHECNLCFCILLIVQNVQSYLYSDMLYEEISIT